VTPSTTAALVRFAPKPNGNSITGVYTRIISLDQRLEEVQKAKVKFRS